MDNLKTLREICKEVGVTRRIVQGYEKANLVSPTDRNKYGHLLYGEKEKNRIKQIKLFQDLGFKLREIKELLDAPNAIVKVSLEKQLLILKEEHQRLETLIARAKKLIAELDEKQEVKLYE